MGAIPLIGAKYLSLRQRKFAFRTIFDAEWYRKKYSLSVSSSDELLTHYIKIGTIEGFDPSPLFDTNYYLQSLPEREHAEVDPLGHFVRFGAARGLRPHPLFDTAWYLARYPDVAASKANPLAHYISFGAAEGRNPHPLFDGSWYLSRAPEARANPLRHYLLEGRFQGLDPHPTFIGQFYLKTFPELKDSNTELLSHYLEDSRHFTAWPNPLFDPEWYLATYPEVAELAIAPLLHYVSYGFADGKDPSPFFDTKHYLATHSDVRNDGMNPLGHYLRYGVKERRFANNSNLPSKDTASDGTTVFFRNAANEYSYAEWQRVNNPGDTIFALQLRQQRAFKYRPVISIIVPVYKIAVELIMALIDSVRAQTYPEWELCIALAYFEDINLTECLKEATNSDPRIKLKILNENGGISRNSNEALELARGEFIGLLDHDDTLSPNALFEITKLLNEDPRIDFIYSDKDKIDQSGRNCFDPLFKPGWSPEWMLSVNYLTHFNVIRTSCVRAIGGWDPTTDGAQDWDLFLRVIDEKSTVRAISRPLYHWRVIESSVASGLSAKPWAATAQLRAVNRYIHNNGWDGADAAFAAENVIRIKWNISFLPRTLILVVGESGLPSGKGWAAAKSAVSKEPSGESSHSSQIDRKSDWTRGFGLLKLFGASTTVPAGSRLNIAYVRYGENGVHEEINKQVAASDAEVIVFIDADCTPDDDWLNELVGPLQNPAIAIVGGRVENHERRLIDAGWVFPDGKPCCLFRGEYENYWGVFGGAAGYRNYLAVTGALMAVRRSAFDAVGGFSLEPAWGRYDLDVGVRISSRNLGRVMLNNYARAVSSKEGIFGRHNSSHLAKSALVFANSFSDGDPYFHPNLVIVGEGRPALRPPAAPGRADYTAEAIYSAAHFDAPASVFKTESFTNRVTHDPIKSIAWFLPDFEVASYGGIMTILRAAEYMRTAYHVRPIFVILSNNDPTVLRARISKAFTELAANCEVRTIQSVDISPDFIRAEAAVSTLWVTAYALLRLQSVRQRFYFIQDFEPLFYPAGTTYSLAEATYRFGFHGICNTYPLRRLYEARGGRADHFLPAVDTTVFNRKGRVKRKSDEPFLLFNYARPGHPRNCFEVVAEGLIEAKRRLKDRVQIVTAGAEWDPKQYGLSGVVEHLGLLSYHDTGKLYRAVDAGLVAMATCHPSYLPFELMACGAAVLTNYNSDTTWLLKDQENSFLFNLTRSAIADTVEAALSDPARVQRIVESAARMIADDYSDWNRSCEVIANAILNPTQNAAESIR